MTVFSTNPRLQALNNVSDFDLQALMDVSQKKGEDAKKLAEETYSGVMEVLKEKSAKARKIAEERKKEASKGKSNANSS